MEVRLPKNATTTPRVRDLIRTCGRPVRELASELGVSETTVRRWRGRPDGRDRSHTPHNLHASTTPLEEALMAELRALASLGLDDALPAGPRRTPVSSSPPAPRPARP
jgi:hypothetical protein